MTRRPRQQARTRCEYAQGLPDYHDPTAGFAGAAPAQSALTLRMMLAVFGLVVCLAGGVLFLAVDIPIVVPVVLFVLAAVALVDIAIIARRNARGEPG